MVVYGQNCQLALTLGYVALQLEGIQYCVLEEFGGEDMPRSYVRI